MRNVSAFFEDERVNKKRYKLNQVVERTAAATGVKIRNAQTTFPNSLVAEVRERNSVVPAAFVTPIRCCLRNIYQRNEMPTLNAILQELRRELAKQNSYHLEWPWSESTLYLFMICNGFAHRKKSFSEYITEKPSVILQRIQFISRIREFRAERRPIFYQDETWVNQCMIPINGYWYNDLGEGGYDIKAGLGARAIVAHVGSSSCGLVDNGLLL